MHFGIDYGSKLAGTTVVTYDEDGALLQVSSAKKSDADAMILALAKRLMPARIYIDAPLSIPAAYRGKGTDYHYRAADKALSAMSPMFLGGLTARAMSLCQKLSQLNIPCVETYPGAYVRAHEELSKVYKKKDNGCIDSCLRVLRPLLPFEPHTDMDTLHKLDSLIAWLSGYRHLRDQATIVGSPDEGVIVY